MQRSCLQIFLYFISLFLVILPTLTLSQPIVCNGKQILGKIETVVISDEDVILDAKLDTGSTMASLSAHNIKIIKIDGKLWVQFKIYSPDDEKNITLIKPLVRYVRILKRSEEHTDNLIEQYAERPVINLSLCIGNKKIMTEVNLIDRSSFQYPMLLGTDALKKLNAVIDVSQKHLVNTSCP